MENLKKVDHSALRTNQTLIISLLLAAFITNTAWLLPLVAAVMLYGSFVMRGAGFGWFYWHILKQLKLIEPDVVSDNPGPHLFAQGLGGFFVLGGFGALYLGWSIPGWGLVWLVISLAGLNLVLGLCVGCMVYYWLNRLGVPGFGATSIPGTFPGMKPPTHQSLSKE